MQSLVLASLLSALLVGAPAGCSRTGARVASGIELYEKGAYEGALIRFREVGPEEASLRKKARVRYLAYRGLAHWHMKETPEAQRFLTEAQEALGEAGADEKWLPADVREELAKACAELGVPTAKTGDAPAPPTSGAPSAGPPTPAPPSSAAPGDAPPAPTAPSAPAPPPSTDPAAPPPSAGSPTGEPPPPLPPGAGSPKAEPLH